MGIVEMFSLAGKKAMVTGGAQGIGKRAALAFAGAGADVAIVDLNLDLARETAREVEGLGVRASALRCDVTDPADVDRTMASLLEEFGCLDVAFNNAGICVNEPAETMSFEAWKRVIDINLTGIFLTARAAGRAMIERRKGSIVNTASMSAHIVNSPQPQCAYNASKAGVIMLTKSLAVEWARYGVRVNSISPGYIGTAMTLKATQWIPTWEAATPAKRMGRPEELESALIYLASDSASFTTGADLVIDGAFTCI